MALRKAAKIIRGEVWHCQPTGADAVELTTWSHGSIAIDASGKIVAVGNSDHMDKHYQTDEVLDFGDNLIIPGFVDAHLHYPQLDIIGSHGEDLLGWLDRYTLPMEAGFANNVVAEKTAKRLITELLANGTTTGVMFSSSHRNATDILFQEASSRGYRAIIGKTSMDRNGPAELLEPLAADLEDQQALIAKWHGHDDRLYYALTPRFAPACTPKLMQAHGELKDRYPDLYIQTHYAESQRELEWVQELFPRHRDYLAVYESFGLISDRTLLAHGIHVKADEWRRLADARAVIVHCPSSNLFLGSGLFHWRQAKANQVRVALGSDIGAGTSLSMWKTMSEAYKVQRLQGNDISPQELFYHATLGGAAALNMDHRIGNFLVGKDADFQVLDWRKCRLMRERFDRRDSVHDRLFALITLGDDRLVQRTFIAGREVYAQPLPPF